MLTALAGNLEPGSVTFEIVRRLVPDVILVTEEEIARAIRFLARSTGSRSRERALRDRGRSRPARDARA